MTNFIQLKGELTALATAVAAAEAGAFIGEVKACFFARWSMVCTVTHQAGSEASKTILGHPGSGGFVDLAAIAHIVVIAHGEC